MKNLFAVIFFLISIPIFSQQVNPNPWVVEPNADAVVTYRNPVIPGFYPDPSVCRVGDDYYLVNSTFEYFPGVPVFHSKDLVNWKQIGHCIDREEQIKGEINIFAPTIRHHNGTFYMITTNVTHGGTFYVTAKDPAGPWSEAIWVDMPEIDPDLFFDDDGRAYVTTSTFELAEINIEMGELLSERKKIWNSTGGRYPEAPHIYKKDGFYYLMAAEGGTEEAHMVTIARSHNIWGPYIDNPANPIATHINYAGMGKPIQGIGHADIIQAHDNSWWMVIHGYRSVTGYPPHHILGRETCLVPVSWPKGGWPVVNGNGTVDVEMIHATLPQIQISKNAKRTDFDVAQLGFEWNYIQPPGDETFQVDDQKGQLKIVGSALQIGEKGSPAFVGRRLTDIRFSATTQLEFDPENENEEAGMALVNNGSHFDFVLKNKDGQRVLLVKLQFGQITYKSEEVLLAPGAVDLKIEGTGPEFIFSYAQNNTVFKTVETADARFLSTQTVGWFTGVYVGLYATGNGKEADAPAVYDWFEYVGSN
ncbi:glycoside hydrolase family 43 protein [Marinilabilia sp.]|uniref:glycoside hydrolase family 43 protein n=1 Tax=Marinilabilia sp. TaxID=2021252 RepID=UPI0025BFA6B9|nr:glycoside hydrolase family 43 protein [Marinilabilia sp.]